jgi:hypothetical protein
MAKRVVLHKRRRLVKECSRFQHLWPTLPKSPIGEF